MSALLLCVHCAASCPVAAATSVGAETFAAPFLGAAFLEGQTYLNERKWAEAVIAFRSVLKHSPDSVPATLGLARALVFSGRREEALAVLARTVENQKKAKRQVLVRRADVLSRVFLTNATFQIFQDGLEMLQQGKFRLARERFDRALAQEPDNVEVLVRLGQALVLERDHDSAAERLRLARRLNPFEPVIRVWLGRALYERGEGREAVSELRSAYAELPESELAAIWLADAMMSHGQKPGTIRLLEDHVKRSPFHLNALVQLARHRLALAGKDEQGQWAARKDLQVALSRLQSAEESTEPAAGPSTEHGFELSGALGAGDLKAETLKLLQQLDKSKPAEARE